MSLAKLRNLGVLLGIMGLLAQPAIAQPIGEWHYIDRDSVLFTEHVEGLHGAGVIQSDQIFALLYPGPPGQNGVVSVVLPTGASASSLKSTLTRSNGLRYVRSLSAEELEIAPVNETDHAYSFPITAEDVRLFQRASTWELSMGDQSWMVTLKGSKKALDMALEKQAAQSVRAIRPRARLALD